MGLRLYQVSVKSDIQSKPAAEKTSAQARSSIRRRNAAPSGGYVARVANRSDRDGQRRRILTSARAGHAARQAVSANAAQDNAERPAQWSLPSDSDSSSDAPAAGENAADEAPDNGRRALRHMASRMGLLDDHIVAMFGERWAHLHAGAGPGPARDDSEARAASPLSPLSAMAVEPQFLAPRRRPFSEAYATSSIRTTQAPGHSSRSSFRRVDSEGNVLPMTSRRERLERLRRAVESNTSFDGLGDRNRSLSPEGDHVWDTLLTTISPDPQPPSVGSSFASASASASATASQSAATGSSRTSFTGPVEVDELLASFDPQCESGCETNSDTEGDEEEYEMPLLRGPIGYSRSYADVTRSTDNNENPVAMLGDIGGFQRIVIGLAQREDIPDEWWAEAGLSRTLSRDASAQ